jgi:hypothetical protein
VGKNGWENRFGEEEEWEIFRGKMGVKEWLKHTLLIYSN